MVELADSLDSGSSVHSGRAGSSPASPTKGNSRKAVSFFVVSVEDRLPKSPKSPWIPNKNRDPRASLLFLSYSYLFVTIIAYFPSSGRQPRRRTDRTTNHFTIHILICFAFTIQYYLFALYSWYFNVRSCIVTHFVL